MINERISELRKIMQNKNIDAYIIPSSDNHQSEYVGEYFKSRQWISGFTGSAGNVVITKDSAELWADGRYHIQAAKQIHGTEINLHKQGLQGVKTYIEWLRDTLEEGSTISFNSKVISVSLLNEMKGNFKDKALNIVPEEDFVDLIWEDRPFLPKGKVFILDEKYAGESRTQKIEKVKNTMKSFGGNAYIISSLDDIAWLLNIRGADVENNPVVLSYFVIDGEKNLLYIDKDKIDKKIEKELLRDNIIVKNYDDIIVDMRNIKNKSILIDPSKTNVWIYNAINNENKIIEHRNLTTEMKAIKNKVEIDNLENCQIKDGIAMVKFIKWLKDNVGNIPMDEVSVADKLESFRKEQDLFIEPSFQSISGYKANAAMMHYSATEDNKSSLKPESLYLIDSGGQYLDGTTDITRTIALGSVTSEEKKDFTLVLKGHIALSKAIFLYGTSGSNLDVLARRPLWEHGIDYKCGTGHGVGFLLNVHEGPQSISPLPNTVKLEEGMIITNEPGIYKEGKYGIRTENTLLVQEHSTTEHGRFMKFKVISYCPIDLDAIEESMLSEEEKQWLNEYHQMVYNKLEQRLDNEEKHWLKNYTRSI